MEYGDTPFYKDGFYIYSTNEMASESDMIEGNQGLDFLDVDQLEELVNREK